MKTQAQQFARILFIDREIRAGKFPNCRRLANEYEVTDRTIRRDIEYMKDMLDAPIEYDSHKRGYYYEKTNYYLPYINIKESELFAILIAEKALELYAATPMYENLKSIFEKLQTYLPDTVTTNTSWVDTHYSFMQESMTHINAEIWETISNSLRFNRELKIRHKSPNKEETSRTVQPYHIVNYRGEWYLIARCLMKNEVLIFGISRISSARMEESIYQIPEDFNLKDYMGSHFGIMRDAKEYPVTIEFTAESAPYITERQWTDTQEIQQNNDGSITLSFKTNSLLEIKRWILSWGAHARVISPPELINAVKSEAEQVLGKYQGNIDLYG